MSSELQRDRWLRLKAAFEEALAASPTGREQLLRNTSEADPAFGRDLAAMLGAHERAEQRPPGSAPPPLAREPDLPRGTRLGEFRVVRTLGEGGMGRVYEAEDVRLHRRVALKILTHQGAGEEVQGENLLREARAAAGLRHPSIPAVYEVGHADGVDYIAMECLDGPTLKARLEGGSLSAYEFLAIAHALASALHYAHSQAVLHGDVKSSNVILPPGELPRLLDFGLARPLTVNRGRSPTSPRRATYGTPACMSPEQARGQPLDTRSDIFSFGCLLYEMAEGKPPYQGSSTLETLENLLRASEPPPPVSLPGLPAAVPDLIQRCLRRDPDQRPADMAAVVDELARCRSPRPVRSRRRSLAGLVTLIILACAWVVSESLPDDLAGGPESTRVGVVAFTDHRRPPGQDQLPGMLSRLVGAEVGAGDHLVLLSQQRLHDIAHLAGIPAAPLSALHAADLAEAADLDIMLLGSLSEDTGRLVASVDVIEVSSGRSLGTPATRADSIDEAFLVARGLGQGVRGLLSTPDVSPQERRALEQQLTSSLPAYRAYAEGMDHLSGRRISAAVDALREATLLDPAFALAHVHLAMALIWTGDEAGPRQAIQRAHAFRDRMPGSLQLLLDASLPYYIEDDTRTALPLLEDVLRLDPWQRDALYMTGEIFTHSATRNSVVKAREAFDQLLRLTPGFSLAYDHALSADLRAGELERAGERVRAWSAAGTPGWRALQAKHELWQGRFEQALALRPDDQEAGLLARTSRESWLPVELPDEIVEKTRSRTDLAGLYACTELDLLAAELVLQGRLDEAGQIYRIAADVDGVESLDGYLTSARAGCRQRLADLAWLLGERDEAVRQVSMALASQPDSYRCLYAAARIEVASGALNAARVRLAELGRLARLGWSPTAAVYRDATEALLCIADGRPEQAIALLSPLVKRGTVMADWSAHADSAGPWFRLCLADAHRALGDVEGERAALLGLTQGGLERLRHPVAWLQAHGRLAELEARAGRVAAARVHQQRVLMHWASCPIEMVRRVRALDLR